MRDQTSQVAVVFDMDGTLFDSEPIFCEAYGRALAERGIRLDPDIYHQSLAGTTNKNIENYLAQTFDDSFSLAHFQAAWPHHFDVILATSELPFRSGIRHGCRKLILRELRNSVVGVR